MKGYSTKVPNKSKKVTKYIIGGLFTFHALSFSISQLYHYLEMKNPIFLNLSPVVRPFDLAIRVETIGLRLLTIFLKHQFYLYKYTDESDQEILSELFKKNSRSLLNLINKYGGIYRKMGS